MNLNGVMDIMGFGENPTDPIDRVFNKYKRMKTMDMIGQTLSDRYFPEKKDRYAEKALALDIQIKRRQLGLPMDDDIYEEDINSSTPDNSHLESMLGIKGMKKTPMEHVARYQPNFLFETIGDFSKTREEINKAHLDMIAYNLREALGDNAADILEKLKSASTGEHNGAGFYSIIKRFHK